MPPLQAAQRRACRAYVGPLLSIAARFPLANTCQSASPRVPCMVEIPELETARLPLRCFSVADFGAYAKMLADPDVTRDLGEARPLSRADAWRQMAMHTGHWCSAASASGQLKNEAPVSSLVASIASNLKGFSRSRSRSPRRALHRDHEGHRDTSATTPAVPRALGSLSRGPVGPPARTFALHSSISSAINAVALRSASGIAS